MNKLDDVVYVGSGGKLVHFFVILYTTWRENQVRVVSCYVLN